MVPPVFPGDEEDVLPSPTLVSPLTPSPTESIFSSNNGLQKASSETVLSKDSLQKIKEPVQTSHKREEETHRHYNTANDAANWESLEKKIDENGKNQQVENNSDVERSMEVRSSEKEKVFTNSTDESVECELGQKEDESNRNDERTTDREETRYVDNDGIDLNIQINKSSVSRQPNPDPQMSDCKISTLQPALVFPALAAKGGQIADTPDMWPTPLVARNLSRFSPQPDFFLRAIPPPPLPPSTSSTTSPKAAHWSPSPNTPADHHHDSNMDIKGSDNGDEEGPEVAKVVLQSQEQKLCAALAWKVRDDDDDDDELKKKREASNPWNVKSSTRPPIPQTSLCLLSPLRAILVSTKLDSKSKCRRLQDLVSITQAKEKVHDFAVDLLEFLNLYPFQQQIVFFGFKQILLCHSDVFINFLKPAILPKLFSLKTSDSYGGDLILLVLTYKSSYLRGSRRSNYIVDETHASLEGQKDSHIGLAETQQLLKICQKRANCSDPRLLPYSLLREWITRIWLDVPTSRPVHPNVLEVCTHWINNMETSLQLKESAFHLIREEMLHLGLPGRGEIWLLSSFFELLDALEGRCSRDLQHLIFLLKRKRLIPLISNLLNSSKWKLERIMSLWRSMCIYGWAPEAPPHFLMTLSRDYGEIPTPYYDLMSSFVHACLLYEPTIQQIHQIAPTLDQYDIKHQIRSSLLEGCLRILTAKAANPLNARDSLQLLIHILLSGHHPFLSEYNDSHLIIQSLIPFLERVKFLWISTKSISHPVIAFLVNVTQLLEKVSREGRSPTTTKTEDIKGDSHLRKTSHSEDHLKKTSDSEEGVNNSILDENLKMKNKTSPKSVQESMKQNSVPTPWKSFIALFKNSRKSILPSVDHKKNIFPKSRKLDKRQKQIPNRDVRLLREKSRSFDPRIRLHENSYFAPSAEFIQKKNQHDKYNESKSLSSVSLQSNSTLPLKYIEFIPHIVAPRPLAPPFSVVPQQLRAESSRPLFRSDNPVNGPQSQGFDNSLTMARSSEALNTAVAAAVEAAVSAATKAFTEGLGQARQRIATEPTGLDAIGSPKSSGGDRNRAETFQSMEKRLDDTISSTPNLNTASDRTSMYGCYVPQFGRPTITPQFHPSLQQQQHYASWPNQDMNNRIPLKSPMEFDRSGYQSEEPFQTYSSRSKSTPYMLPNDSYRVQNQYHYFNQMSTGTMAFPINDSAGKREVVLQTYLELPITFNRYIEFEFRQPTTGLQNLGNTCYLNAFLQALFLCNAFVSNLFRFKMKKSSDDSNFLLLRELQILFAMMLHKRKDVVNPKAFLNTLPEFYRCGMQQDSTEVARYILSALGGYAQDLVKLVFAGQVVTKNQCLQCLKISEKIEIISDIGFPIPTENEFYKLKSQNPSYTVSVQTLFDSYLHPEVLDGENLYQCDQCNMKVKATRWTEIQSPPAHLFVILNRYSWDAKTGEKNKEKTHVEVEEKIIVWGLQYELYAVVMHQGATCNSGHYYTYGCRSEIIKCKRKGFQRPRVFKFDDTRITTEASFDVVNSDLRQNKKDDDRAYSLFYRCTAAPQAPAPLFPASLLRDMKSKELE